MELDTLSISIPVPAVQGYFGTRIATYTTQVQPLQITRILGHDPRSKNWKLLPPATREIYVRIQRDTDKNRREGVVGYIEQRFGTRPGSVGAFPAISIGITKATRFELLPGQLAIGHLHLQEGECIVLDGLGRISGCLDLAEEGPEGKELVKKLVMPVTFYVPFPGSDPLTVEDLGQLFMDFNFRVHPVPARIAIALDQSDTYIALTNAIAKEPFIAAHGGMERKSASRGKKSASLVVQAVLLRTVRGACEGRDFQESNQATASDPNLTDTTFRQEFDSITEFFSEIALRMGERWSRFDSLHLTAFGWQALGVIHHDMHHRRLTLSSNEKAHIYDAIASLDWSRQNREWVEQAGLGEWTIPKGGVTEQVTILGAGRNNTQATLDFLRKRTGLQSKLDAVVKSVAA